jgi:hypothetical protein
MCEQLLTRGKVFEDKILSGDKRNFKASRERAEAARSRQESYPGWPNELSAN